MSGGWRRWVGLVALALAPGCMPAIKPFTLTVKRLDVQRVNITGMGLEVGFLVRNPNPEALRIARFDYTLKLNGHKVGTGYYAEPVELKGFGEAPVSSRFDVGFLGLPGAVKAVLDGHRADADVVGTFYVEREGSLKKVHFQAQADVPIGH